MRCDYSEKYILNLIYTQLSTFLIENNEKGIIENILDKSMKRVEYCFSSTSNKYYSKNGETYFNPYHSGQWCIFLYFLSNTLYQSNKSNSKIADKIYYLNRTLNGVDLFYEVCLPDIFMLDHPLGTVIGRGSFKNYFSFAQGCTVGNNKGIYPIFGENVKMLSNSKVLGDSLIGDNVIIAANTYIKDQNIESNVVVYGASPNLTIKPNKNS